MPDDINNVWVDITFTDDQEESGDVPVQVRLADSENIGSYSMPVVYKQEEVVETSTDVWLQYFQELTSISGIENVPVDYIAFERPMVSGTLISLVEFFSGDPTTSGTKEIDSVYSTGYNTISGALNEVVTFIGGKQYPASDNILANYWGRTSLSGIMEWWTNYTNFSGNLDTGGNPIPFHWEEYNYRTLYTAGYITSSGVLDGIVDVTFAGWPEFSLPADIYSTILNFENWHDTEVTVVSGGVQAHYLDAISSDLTTSGIESDIYCSLLDYLYLNFEVSLTPGRVGYIGLGIYSTIETTKYLTVDVDLLSLKITNFSLDVGEHATSSGFISVDVLDDECPVSTSGTYFMVDDVRVPVTLSGIYDGYRVFYTPVDSFNYLEGPTVFTVHSENECGDILEQDYYLTFGYMVEYDNGLDSPYSIDYGFDSKVAVRVTAENYASCPQLSSLAWEFESKTQVNCDLGASINGRLYALDNSDMSANIQPHSTAYFYGKEFTVVVNAKDFAGNKMEPLILSYRIEDKPT